MVVDNTIIVCNNRNMGTNNYTSKIHCGNCGRANPGTVEGYTGCCGELVCYGEANGLFGNPDVPRGTRRSCCWAKAAEAFGGWDNVPDDSYRVQ